MSRPSDGMTLDELRDEFDWMFEFQSRMAERIRQDADVHSLVDYVTGLEAENARLRAMRDTWAENDAKLRELVVALYHIHFGTEEESWDALEDFCPCDICEERHGGEAPCAHTAKDLADECCNPITKEIVIDRMHELGVEVDG